MSTAAADDLPMNSPAPGAAAAAETRAPVGEPQARTHAEDRTGTSGLGIGGGLGSDNVGLGGHLIYYQQLPNPKLRIAVHVGAGVRGAVSGYVQWGVSGGSFVAFGKRHRLVFGVTGGTVEWLTFALHSQIVDGRQVFGAGVGAGYEFMTKSGFYLRATVGPALAVYPKVPFRDREVDLVWRGNLLTMGYKLW